jgi:hypothetical protein
MPPYKSSLEPAQHGTPTLGKGSEPRRRPAAFLAVALLALLTVLPFAAIIGPPGGGSALGECLQGPPETVGDSIICASRNAFVIFRTPAEMTLGQSSEVTLELHARLHPVATPPPATTRTDSTGLRVDSAQVSVSEGVLAVLEGVAFDIDPPPDRAAPVAVTTIRPSLWVWEVTPSKRGLQRLAVRLRTGPLLAPTASLEFFPVSRRIPVRITLLQRGGHLVDWMVAHWALLAAATGLISGILIFARARRRRPAGFGRS